MITLALQPPDPAYLKKVQDWRAKHEADYTRDYVPLEGLFALKPGANTAGSRPGSDIQLPSRAPASIGQFIYQNGQVRFEPAAGADVALRGKPVTAPLTLRPDGEPEPPDELTMSEISLWVHQGGGALTIRMRDPQGTQAKSFKGFKWFPVDPSYRVIATFIKDPQPRQVKMAVLTGGEDAYTTEGVVEFALHGQRVRMRPMTTRPNRFYFVFRDATAGAETYEAARFLYSDLLPDGTTVLDFNEAYNPPCAFNPYTTCPLPLPENRLTIPIRAGEMNYQK